MQLDPYDLDQIDAIVNQLYNIARRHGYPMDLSDLFREAEGLLARYRAAADEHVVRNQDLQAVGGSAPSR